jgi:hypothetical protein
LPAAFFVAFAAGFAVAGVVALPPGAVTPSAGAGAARNAASNCISEAHEMGGSGGSGGAR